MKKIIVTSFFILHSTFIIFSQGTWTAKANLGTPSEGRSKGAGFELNGYGYVGTGYNGTARKDFWRYNPATNVWTQIADFGGTARYGAVGFSVNGYGYIGTGFTTPSYAQDIWRYNDTTNSWTQMADFGGAGRMDAVAFTIGNRVFIGTGYDGSARNDFYRYNVATDTWTARANFSGAARYTATGFAANGRGYIGLGRSSTTTYYNTLYQYDTTANTWTTRANFTGAARAGAAGFVFGNNAYVGTGESANTGNLYQDFYKYDPIANSWNTVASFTGTARCNTVSFNIGNLGYVGTGYNLAQTNTFFEFTLCAVTLSVTPTNVSCNGGSNGSINLTVSGATPTVTYLWSNASSTEDVSGLTAGGYTVLVTDGAGCTKTTTVTITQPTPLVGSVTTITNASCNSLCNGKITIAPTGGTPAYTYSWAPNTGSTSSVSNLCAGTYTATITDSKGCMVTLDTVITQPTLLSSSVSVTNPSSACICDGSVNGTTSGGVTPYTYQWCTGATSSTITGLCPGLTCIVSVTDNNGCNVLDTFNFNVSPLTVSLATTPATCPTCPNGDATANPAGGNSPFTYSWEGGQTTQTATGLAPGTYSVCVADADSCVTCDSVYVGFAIGIAEYDANNILISPNPSSGKFSISSSQFIIDRIDIYNIIGEIILSVPETRNRQSTEIDISSKEDGIYFIKIIPIAIGTAKGISTKKIVLSR